MKKGILTSILDRIERIGNKLPDPTTMFVILAASVILLSWLFSMIGVTAIHPADARSIAVDNLLSTANLRRIFTEMVKNFSNFPPLGMVLVTVIGIGVAEKSGLVDSALKKLVTVVPKSLLTATLVFGGIMSNMAADAGYIVLTPLGAVLFAGFGRHPLAGLAAAFAGVSGGFSANLLLTSLDPLLGGITTTSAKIIDPNYEVLATANYYFMIASTFVLTIVGTLVTEKIIEPRLGEWKSSGSLDSSLKNVSANEGKGLLAAGLAFVVFVVGVALLAIPEGAVLRDEKGDLKPFYDSLVPLIMIMFLICGLAYGTFAKTIRSEKDAVKMSSDYMATMGGYIVLAFVMAQFIAYFAWSNMGLVIAIKGAEFLKVIGLTGVPLMIVFIVVTGGINLFIGSASAKWAIMGPVFVPMFMLMGYSPELVQNTYRIGDSITNIISPLLPYYPIIIAFAKKYDPRIGMGTLISTMLPYSIAFGVMWTLMLCIWMLFGLPIGPDVNLYFDPTTVGK